jgi:hypothetical protein
MYVLNINSNLKGKRKYTSELNSWVTNMKMAVFWDVALMFPRCLLPHHPDDGGSKLF